MAVSILQFCHYKPSSGAINRLRSIHPSFQLFQYNYFATQRPKSIISLSNPNRKRSQDLDNSSLIDWKNYDISFYQYYHDPRSSQFRILMDYFNMPYNCIEVTPFKKIEFSVTLLPEEHHHAPLLLMTHRTKVKETIDTFKKQAVQYIPNGYRHEALQIANITTFKERINDYINKYDGKTPEEKDSYKEKVHELYEHYDTICNERYNKFFHHDDFYTSFVPFIESNLSNDQHRRIFNDKCDSDKILFYTSKYVWTLQACTAKSFHSCFQLMSYVKMFRKLRKWSRFMIERTHLIAAIKLRVLRKRKYCKKAQTGNQPKGAAMKLTYEFLQTFNVDMPDLNNKGKIPKPKDINDDNDNTKADISLIGKPFHGGRSPDILDLLVYGALRGTQGLDVYTFLFRKATQIEDWYTRMQDEVGKSSCIKHI
eukprot:263827_1